MRAWLELNRQTTGQHGWSKWLTFLGLVEVVSTPTAFCNTKSVVSSELSRQSAADLSECAYRIQRRRSMSQANEANQEER